MVMKNTATKCLKFRWTSHSKVEQIPAISLVLELEKKYDMESRKGTSLNIRKAESKSSEWSDLPVWPLEESNTAGTPKQHRSVRTYDSGLATAL